MNLRCLNARKIIESITLLSNSIKKTKKRKMQTSQTYRFFCSVYIKSRQNYFVLQNKGATMLFK